MSGPHLLMRLAVDGTVVTAKPAAHHASLLHDVFGWLIVGLVVFVAVKFIKGQRNKAKASADALAQAMAALVAEVHASASAHAGADARNAMAVHIGSDGRRDDDDLDQLAARVAALLRADLSAHDGHDARPDLNDQLYRAAADMLASPSPRLDFDAYRDAGRAISARAAQRGRADRDDSQVTA